MTDNTNTNSEISITNDADSNQLSTSIQSDSKPSSNPSTIPSPSESNQIEENNESHDYSSTSLGSFISSSETIQSDKSKAKDDDPVADDPMIPTHMIPPPIIIKEAIFCLACNALQPTENQIQRELFCKDIKQYCSKLVNPSFLFPIRCDVNGQ